MCELRLPLPATSTQALVQALCSKYAPNSNMTGVVYCTIVYNCIIMLSLTGGHQLSTPSSKEPGLSNTVLLACSAPRWCLMRIYLFRTHTGIAAVALSDFVTDAAGLIDAHDVARVLLQLHSRCFLGLILAKNLLTV